VRSGGACLLAFSGDDSSEQWILGDAILSKHYSVYDLQHNRVGFAKARPWYEVSRSYSPTKSKNPLKGQEKSNDQSLADKGPAKSEVKEYVKEQSTLLKKMKEFRDSAQELLDLLG